MRFGFGFGLQLGFGLRDFSSAANCRESGVRQHCFPDFTSLLLLSLNYTH